MTKTFKKHWALSFLLIATLPSFTQAASPAKAEANSQITIRLYNYSDLPQAAQARAETVASDILRKAGITAQWLDCPIAKAQQLPACSLPLRPTELVLRILPGSKASRAALDRASCGYALRPTNGGHGTLVTLFFDCVEKIAKTHQMLRGLVLGHTAAHEIDHMLLPPGHSSLGIMRARLCKTDWKRVAKGTLIFTPQQSEQLSTGLRSRLHQQQAVQTAGLAPTR
jgi:hypothetical protein